MNVLLSQFRQLPMADVTTKTERVSRLDEQNQRMGGVMLWIGKGETDKEKDGEPA